MVSGWRILDCSSMRGQIKSARGQIVVETHEGAKATFPVEDLAVVLIGVNTSFSAGVLHRLNGADVAVLLCDWRGVPVGASYHWSEHTRVGARNLAQVGVSVPRKKALWAAIVRSKVKGQAAALKNLDRTAHRRLNGLAAKVKSGDPSNIEAQAARLYWSALMNDEDFNRTPGGGLNLNSCLDYGYAILRGHGIRAVLAAGLNPALGVFHRGRSNLFNLVDDVIEPFRPAIDEVVASLDAEASPTEPEIKHNLVAAANQRFLEDGSTIPTVLEKMAQNIGQYFEGDIDKVTIPTWVGPAKLGESLGDKDGG